MLMSMGDIHRPLAAAFLGAALTASLAMVPAASAQVQVPVPTANAFVIPGANFDAWAPAILEPIDPGATDGPLIPQINARYYTCGGCTPDIIRYPRTMGPLFGPGAPFADESIAIGSSTVLDDLRGAEGTSVVSSISLGAITADVAQRALDADPGRPPSSRIIFITTSDPSRVTPLSTGIGSYFPVGVRIPVLGWTVTRPPAESPYDTVVVVGEYDWSADFPDRPWNLLADLNAIVGFDYSHTQASLTDPADIPADNIVTTTNSMGATTTTYLVPSPEIPLLKPFDKVLPAPVISAANGILKPLVDRGYSRYDAVTGNHMPYLRPTAGLPELALPGAPAGSGGGTAPAPARVRAAAAVSAGHERAAKVNGPTAASDHVVRSSRPSRDSHR